MADEKRQYVNKILFGRLSKAGNHIYAYQHEDILADGVKSLLINVSELQDVISGKADYVKISAMEANEEETEQSVISPSNEEDSAPAHVLFGNLASRKEDKKANEEASALVASEEGK